MENNIFINHIQANLKGFHHFYYKRWLHRNIAYDQYFFAGKLLSLQHIKDFKSLLKFSIPEINKVLNNPHYDTFLIPKKSGGFRNIQSPEPPLMYNQWKLNVYLQNYYHLIRPAMAYGFVINPNKYEKLCNIVENAKNHVNQKQVLNLDLKDFFPSIKAYRVKELFLSKHFLYTEPVANALALLVTFEGQLPTGAPTSPVISNFICLELDDDLAAFAVKNKLNYSRYADDLTFSTNAEISKETIHSITQIIKKHHFELNPKKTRLKSNNRKQTVTGLVVNDKVNVDRKTIKMVRAMLHDTLQNGIAKASKKHWKTNNLPTKMTQTYFMNRLKGYINFIAQVRGNDDELVTKFRYHYKMIYRLA